MQRGTSIGTSVAAVALAISTLAQAQVVQTQDFGPSTPNFEATLTFDKYAGPATDLASVALKLELATMGGSLTVDNDGQDPATVTASLGLVGLVSSDQPLINSAFTPIFPPTGVNAVTQSTFNLGPENGDGTKNVDGSAPDGAVHVGTDGTETITGFLSEQAFGSYAGGGTFDVTVSVNQLLDLGGEGGLEGSFLPTTADGVFTVTYELVPEPGTASVVGLLGAMGLLARRRRTA